MEHNKLANVSKTNIGLGSVENLTPAEIAALMRHSVIINPNFIPKDDLTAWEELIKSWIDKLNECIVVTQSEYDNLVTNSKLKPTRLYKVTGYKANLDLCKGNLGQDIQVSDTSFDFYAITESNQLQNICIAIVNDKSDDFTKSILSSRLVYFIYKDGYITQMTDTKGNYATFDFISVKNSLGKNIISSDSVGVKTKSADVYIDGSDVTLGTDNTKVSITKCSNVSIGDLNKSVTLSGCSNCEINGNNTDINISGDNAKIGSGNNTVSIDADSHDVLVSCHNNKLTFVDSPACEFGSHNDTVTFTHSKGGILGNYNDNIISECSYTIMGDHNSHITAKGASNKIIHVTLTSGNQYLIFNDDSSFMSESDSAFLQYLKLFKSYGLFKDMDHNVLVGPKLEFNRAYDNIGSVFYLLTNTNTMPVIDFDSMLTGLKSYNSFVLHNLDVITYDDNGVSRWIDKRGNVTDSTQFTLAKLIDFLNERCQATKEYIYVEDTTGNKVSPAKSAIAYNAVATTSPVNSVSATSTDAAKNNSLNSTPVYEVKYPGLPDGKGGGTVTESGKYYEIKWDDNSNKFTSGVDSTKKISAKLHNGSTESVAQISDLKISSWDCNCITISGTEDINKSNFKIDLRSDYYVLTPSNINTSGVYLVEFKFYGILNNTNVTYYLYLYINTNALTYTHYIRTGKDYSYNIIPNINSAYSKVDAEVMIDTDETGYTFTPNANETDNTSFNIKFPTINKLDDIFCKLNFTSNLNYSDGNKINLDVVHQFIVSDSIVIMTYANNGTELTESRAQGEEVTYNLGVGSNDTEATKDVISKISQFKVDIVTEYGKTEAANPDYDNLESVDSVSTSSTEAPAYSSQDSAFKYKYTVPTEYTQDKYLIVPTKSTLTITPVTSDDSFTLSPCKITINVKSKLSKVEVTINRVSRICIIAN